MATRSCSCSHDHGVPRSGSVTAVRAARADPWRPRSSPPLQPSHGAWDPSRPLESSAQAWNPSRPVEPPVESSGIPRTWWCPVGRANATPGPRSRLMSPAQWEPKARIPHRGMAWRVFPPGGKPGRVPVKLARWSGTTAGRSRHGRTIAAPLDDRATAGRSRRHWTIAAPLAGRSRRHRTIAPRPLVGNHGRTIARHWPDDRGATGGATGRSRHGRTIAPRPGPRPDDRGATGRSRHGTEGVRRLARRRWWRRRRS